MKSKLPTKEEISSALEEVLNDLQDWYAYAKKDDEVTVKEVANALGLHRTRAASRLQQLVQSGKYTARKAGHTIYYRKVKPSQIK